MIGWPDATSCASRATGGGCSLSGRPLFSSALLTIMRKLDHRKGRGPAPRGSDLCVSYPARSRHSANPPFPPEMAAC